MYMGSMSVKRKTSRKVRSILRLSGFFRFSEADSTKGEQRRGNALVDFVEPFLKRAFLISLLDAR